MIPELLIVKFKLNEAPRFSSSILAGGWGHKYESVKKLSKIYGLKHAFGLYGGRIPKTLYSKQKYYENSTA